MKLLAASREYSGSLRGPQQRGLRAAGCRPLVYNLLLYGNIQLVLIYFEQSTLSINQKKYHTYRRCIRRNVINLSRGAINSLKCYITLIWGNSYLNFRTSTQLINVEPPLEVSLNGFERFILNCLCSLNRVI